jgi:hypothetical protein
MNIPKATLMIAETVLGNLAFVALLSNFFLAGLAFRPLG